MFSIKKFKKLCTKEELARFDKAKKKLIFESKERIFSQGDPVSGIYFVEKGHAKVLSKGFDGEEKIIRLVSEDMILGHRGLNRKEYLISAEALTSTVLTFLPMNIFLQILNGNPKLCIYLIEFMTEELLDAEIRTNNLLVLDPRTRIAHVLCKSLDTFGYDKLNKSKLSFTVSRSDISNMAGTTYETVIRTLALFNKKKLIRIEGKSLIILDETLLRKIGEGRHNID